MCFSMAVIENINEISVEHTAGQFFFYAKIIVY